VIAQIDTPCGPLWISGGKDSVDTISWSPLEGPRDHGELDWVLYSLDSYFSGKLQLFPGGLLFMGTGPLWVPRSNDSRPFLSSHHMLAAIGRIPFGKAVSYATVASWVGKPRAARAVGAVCRSNPLPVIIPCHRVVGSNSLGGYTPGIHLKEMLLKHEGYLNKA
jgi:methylated-DNA-[protein]-cysteine S-methyltransferase